VGLALSGVIAVVDRMVDGRQTISQLLHPGDLFDLGTAPIEPSEALTALTAASYVALDEEVWRGLLGADRRLADASYARLGEQTRRLRRHISAIAFTTPLERLSATLLELRRRAPDGTEAAGQDPRLALEIRRRDLSEHVGLKPETVSRSFRQLEQEGVIAIEEKGLLRMIDVAELERIAQGGRPRASTRG
ncbi:MAG: Crp/Fnr family transcriptional regulator, partial [Pseudomonadota bacterium]